MLSWFAMVRLSWYLQHPNMIKVSLTWLA